MPKFQPTVVAKKGADNAVANTPAELVNLQAQGYRKVPAAAAETGADGTPGGATEGASTRNSAGRTR